jgi:hypothetical protein
MRFYYGIAAAAVVLGVAVSAAPARANIITDAISFTLDAADVSAGAGSYDPTAVTTVSFDFKYNTGPGGVVSSPTTPISPAITNLSYSVTSSLFGTGTFDAINYYSFVYGVLALSSSPTLDVGLTGTDGITIKLGGFGGGTSPLASVWYSQSGLPGTYNATGPYDISILNETVVAPLPSTWTMLIAGFLGLAFFAYRGPKKDIGAIAAA